MDAAERRSVRNVVGMAEVKLGRLAVDDRDLAMAQIQAFVNGGEVVLRAREDGEEGEGGGEGGGRAWGRTEMLRGSLEGLAVATTSFVRYRTCVRA